MTRPLPDRDVHALFDVVVTFLGHLIGGDAPPEMVQHMIRRLAKDGFLRPDASAEELAAVLDDLVQRLHVAMGDAGHAD